MVDIKFCEHFIVTQKDFLIVFYIITEHFISLDLWFSFLHFNFHFTYFFSGCVNLLLSFLYLFFYVSRFMLVVSMCTVMIYFLLLFFSVRQCLINTVSFFPGKDDRWLQGARECLLLVLHLTLGFVFILPLFHFFCSFVFVCPVYIFCLYC